MTTIPIPPGAISVTIDFVVAADTTPAHLIPNPTSLAIADLSGHPVSFVATNAAGSQVSLPALNLGTLPSNFTAHITAPDTVTFSALSRAASTQTGTLTVFI